MSDIPFKLTDYYDLLNLYKIIMEAKFHPAPVNEEVAVRPYTAKFCGELVDLLAQYEQETKGKERWSDWRMLCCRPDYRERILEQLCRYRQDNPQRWERMEAVGRQQLLRNAISPFTCSDEEFDELQRELEQRIAQRKPTYDGTLKSCNEVFLRAKAKKTYRDTAEFQNILDALRQAEPSLRLDWDDGAGEEWARGWTDDGFFCMLHARIGVAFVRGLHSVNAHVAQVLSELYVEEVEEANAVQWHVDLAALRAFTPEVCWHASHDAVSEDGLSLNDLYFATV